MKSSAERALPPMEFRFTDADDIGKYGDVWFTFDEGYWLRRPARELIELETELGTPLIYVLNGSRSSTAFGDTAAAWLGVRITDPARAGEFDSFNPLVMTIEWRKAEGKAPAAPAATPEPPVAGRSPSTTSGTPATVVLQNSPIAGSES